MSLKNKIDNNNINYMNTFLNNYKTNSMNYNYQSLLGGKYNIPLDKINDFFNVLVIDNSVPICEKINGNFTLYFDIDNINDINIDDILQELFISLSDIYGNDAYQSNKITFNSSKNKYHIYYPDIVVNKKYIKNIIKYLNNQLSMKFNLNDILDINGYNTCFRLPYCVKKINDIESIYYLKYGEDDNDDCNDIKIKYLNLIRLNTNKQITNFDNTNIKNNIDTDIIINEVEENKEVEEILNKYKTSNFYNNGNGKYYTLKNYKCPFNHHIKNRNNRSICIFKNIMFIKCNDVETCKGKKQILWENKNTINNMKIDTTDDTLSKLFSILYKDEFIYVYEDEDDLTGKFYFFNDVFWKYDKNESYLSKFISNDFYLDLDTELTERIRKQTDEDKQKPLLELKKQIMNLKNINKRKNVIQGLKCYINKCIEMNNHPYKIVFKNGIYDTKMKIFRNSKPEEYISDEMNMGYDFINENDINEEDFNFINEYINKTFINSNEDKSVFLQYLSTSLIGINDFKKFMLCNGSGNNNKSKLLEFVNHMLGNYGYRLNISNLCGKIDATSINKLNKKRFVYTEEPNCDVRLDTGFLKELTGNKQIDFRKIYSNSSKVIVDFSLFISCNTRPPFSSIDDALRRRLIDFPFLSTFTNKDINNIDRFIINPYFGSYDFKNKYKIVLFHYLLKYLDLFYENKEQINLTNELEKRRDQYLIDSDDFYGWFNDNYDFTNDKTDIIKFKDIFNDFKMGSYYSNLSSYKRRKVNKKSFKEELLSRKDIKELWRNVIKIDCIKYKSVLIGIKQKEYDDDE